MPIIASLKVTRRSGIVYVRDSESGASMQSGFPFSSNHYNSMLDEIVRHLTMLAATRNIRCIGGVIAAEVNTDGTVIKPHELVDWIGQTPKADLAEEFGIPLTTVEVVSTSIHPSDDRLNAERQPSDIKRQLAVALHIAYGLLAI